MISSTRRSPRCRTSSAIPSAARRRRSCTRTTGDRSTRSLLPVLRLCWLQNPRKRLKGYAILGVSLVPVFLSLNRGLWLSLGVALLYAGTGQARCGSFSRKALAHPGHRRGSCCSSSRRSARSCRTGRRTAQQQRPGVPLFGDVESGEEVADHRVRRPAAGGQDAHPAGHRHPGPALERADLPGAVGTVLFLAFPAAPHVGDQTWAGR